MRPVKLPKAVESHEYGGAVARAAAHACAGRNALDDIDATAQVSAACLLQSERSSNAQVLTNIAHDVARASDCTAFVEFQGNVVHEINENEDGLEKMHAVLAASDDVQKEVEFGGSLDLQACFGHNSVIR